EPTNYMNNLSIQTIKEKQVISSTIQIPTPTVIQNITTTSIQTIVAISTFTQQTTPSYF
ncbi:29635_t:CDS:1, partial [Racocetra persica]